MNEKGFLKRQYLDVDEKTGKVELINHMNDDELLKEVKQERETNTNNGMSEKKTMRHVAQIPSFLFHHEPLLKEYHANVCENPEYARKCLRMWLRMHPEYKCNDGNI